VLQQGGFATLLLDLLTAAEEQVDLATGYLRFDIGRWPNAAKERQTRSLPIAYFGASTGAGAALIAATERPLLIKARREPIL
jgi:putative phosphoribosyl transferase